MIGMARTKKVEIWSKVGEYPSRYLETVKNQESAEALVRMYERQDRYERDVEGYTNPLPSYEIRIQGA